MICVNNVNNVNTNINDKDSITLDGGASCFVFPKGYSNLRNKSYENLPVGDLINDETLDIISTCTFGSFPAIEVREVNRVLVPEGVLTEAPYNLSILKYGGSQVAIIIYERDDEVFLLCEAHLDTSDKTYKMNYDDLESLRTYGDSICENSARVHVYSYRSKDNRDFVRGAKMMRGPKVRGNCNLLEVLHVCYGHLSEKVLKWMVRHGMIKGIGITYDQIRNMSLPICESCMLAKCKRSTIRSSIMDYSFDVFECISIDIVPIALNGKLSIDGYGYIMQMIDIATKKPFWSAKVTATAMDVQDTLQDLIAKFGPNANPLSKKLRVVNADSGGVFLEHKLRQWFHDQGIHLHLAAPYMHEAVRVEREIYTIKDGTRTIMSYNNAPFIYYVHAWAYYCSTLGFTPQYPATISRDEAFFGKIPDTSHAVPFYSYGFYNCTAEEYANKGHSNRGRACRMLCYATDISWGGNTPQIKRTVDKAVVNYNKAYVILDILTNKRLIRGDCHFEIHSHQSRLTMQGDTDEVQQATLNELVYDIDSNLASTFQPAAINSSDELPTKEVPMEIDKPVESSEVAMDIDQPVHTSEVGEEPQPEKIDTDEEFIVQTVITHRGNEKKKSTLEFYIKWQGYSAEHNSWITWFDARYVDKVHMYLTSKGLRHLIPPVNQTDYISHVRIPDLGTKFVEDSITNDPTYSSINFDEYEPARTIAVYNIAMNDLFSPMNTVLRLKLFTMQARHKPPQPVKYTSLAMSKSEMQEKISAVVDEEPTILDVPITEAQALQSPDSSHWIAAMQEETQKVESRSTWRVHNSNVQADPTLKCIKSRFVFRLVSKSDGTWRYKARLVACGYTQQYGKDYDETFAPTAKYKSLCTILNIAATQQWEIYGLDVENAFVDCDLTEHNIDMLLPFPHFQQNGKPVKVRLQKALYGLKQAAELFYQKLAGVLRDIGLRQCVHDECVFIEHDTNHKVYLAIYVDDILLTGSDPRRLQAIIEQIRPAFTAIKVDATCKRYIGVDLKRDEADGSITLCQIPYNTKIINDNIPNDASTADTPLCPSVDYITPPVDKQPGTILAPLGQLRYTADKSRPDLLAPLSLLARNAHQPGRTQLRGVKQVFRYIQADPARGVKFCKADDNDIVLWGMCDASYITKDDSKSQYGFALFLNLNSGTVYARSSKSRTVDRSATEAEIKAIDETIKAILWFRGFLEELGYPQNQPTVIFTDSESAVTILTTNRPSSNTGHVTMRINAINESIKTRQIELKWISTNDNIADILTKQTVSTQNRLLSQQLLQGVGNVLPTSTKPIKTARVSNITKLKKITKFKVKKADIDMRLKLSLNPKKVLWSEDKGD